MSCVIALDERDRLAAQPACQQIFIDVGRQRGGRAPHLRRIAAQDNRARDEVFFDLAGLALVFRAALVPLPVHHQRLSIVLLQAIHAHIALPCHRIARDDLRQRDVRAAIVRPAFEDRQNIQRGILGDHDFLAGRAARHARPKPDAAQHAEHLAAALDHLAHALRQFRIDQPRQVVPQVFEIVHAQRQRHPPRRAEGVDQHRHGAAFDVFKQQRLILVGRAFADPIGDLGDFQVGADRGGDADQFALGFQARDKVAQIGVGHTAALHRLDFSERYKSW